MTTVARSRGEIPPPTRRLIEAGQKVLLGTSEPLDRLAPITPEELAAAIERPEIRSQLVNGMVMASLSAGEPPPVQAQTVREFADALHVRGPQLSAIEKIAHHDVLFFKLCILRNGHLPDAIKDEYHRSGVLGVAKALARLRGLREDPEVAARFQAWEKLAPETLGAHVFRHYRDHGFALPGEKGGFPESGMYHDFSHVLAGYDTTLQGETLVGGFIAGFRENRPDHGLFTALFVLSIFSTGVDVTPIGVGASTGIVGEVAERFLLAIQRGSELPLDLSDDWNFWDYIELPLEEARSRLGVPPKTEFGPGDSPL
ncbi:MAG: hypothetical protein CMJ89_11665 [Planctomycetes bacterium]|jgi:hypothetical protein|nr:hypothetical protein [Planctomycetota bacterium]